MTIISANTRKPKPPKRVTLEDVAKHAGVSRATASLVVRGSDLVTDETREKVVESMHALGYVYNRAAAILRSNRSRSIGLIVTDITNPFFAEMALGSEAALEDANYTVLLGNTSEKKEKQDLLIETMHGYAVDGILLCPAIGTSPITVERLRDWRLPFVLVARYFPGIDVDYVGADNLAGARMAVSYLIASGHKRIAFIGGPENSSARADRYQGYLQAMEENGLTIDPNLSAASSVTREGGNRAMLAMLDLPKPPTACFCYNDVVAFGALLALQKQGRKPGKDFDLIGFDDVEEAAMCNPPLSTVSISPQQIGVEAARLLLERMEHPNTEPRNVVLPPRLVIRETSQSLSTLSFSTL